MKENIWFYIILTVICGACMYVSFLLTGHLDFEGVLFGVFLTVISLLLVCAVRALVWRAQNGVDLFATLETSQEKVKEHMLFVMQWGHSQGIVGTIKEFNDIFRNYPQWKLQDWEVFRAWYKYEIDFMLEYPEIYGMTLSDGSPYSKDRDPLYSPDAPDWAQFDREHYEDDDDEDDEDDDFSDDGPNCRKSAADDFYTGIGLGATDNFLNR